MLGVMSEKASEFDPRRYPAAWTVPVSMGEAGNWMEHVPFGCALVEALEPATVVELGVEYGDSYLAFCQTVAAGGRGGRTKCFAVDTWRGDAHTGNYQEAVYQTVVAGNAPYAGFSTLMRTTFDEARGSFGDGSVDLLHIDGLHTYEAVRQDFETWLPKVSSRGVVLFHDTAERSRDFGVWRLWGEVSGRYLSCEFGFGHGLGVLLVGGEVPVVVKELVGAVRGEAGVAEYFGRLGAGISAMQTARVLAGKVAVAQDLVNQWKRLVGASDQMVGGKSPREDGDRLIQGVHMVASADLQLRQDIQKRQGKV